MTDHEPNVPPTVTIADDSAPIQQLEPYFTVGQLKFSLMSIATFGIYKLYWFYRNWAVIRRNTNATLSPFWRAFFSPLWSYSMGTRLAEHGRLLNVPISTSFASLAAAYFVMQALWRLPDPYWLISLLSFVPLIPFDSAARRLNGDGQLAIPTHGRYSGWNIALLVIGFLFLALVVIGLSLPDAAA
jgi:hypothetical protein